MNTSTRRRRRISTLAVSGAAVLALGLGACGGGDDSASKPTTATSSPATELTAMQVVKASSVQSKEAGSGKFSFTMDGTASGQALNFSGDGAFDIAKNAFEMTMSLPAEAGGTKLTFRMVDGVAYLSGAPLTAEGQWMKMPLDQLGATGLDTSSMDPAKSLEQLEGVADGVEEVAPISVRGVQAKGYAGTIDAAKALELAPAEQQTDEAKAAAAQLGSIPFTLYVDDQNRPVRMTEQITVEGSTLNVSMDYYDWGSSVDVAAPDPASVTQAPDMGALAGESAAAGA
ncbi:hypothetical protein ACFQ46_01980 [Kineococcus sp. GCM10028916]|uniref:hypothetical protein n=1 Tax=Kineococcus sp. GCM10028916 TaxID=3273394 RepID=UPI003638664E